MTSTERFWAGRRRRVLDRLVGAARRVLRRRGGPAADDRYRETWNAAAQVDALTAILTPPDGVSVENEARFDEKGRQDAAWLRGFATPDAVVLDVGCGIGRIERHLAPHVARVHAVDVSEVMLAAAARRTAGLANVRLHRASATDLSAIATASVDLAFSLFVLQHLEHEDAFRALREISRVLRPEGRAVLQFPSLASSHYAVDFARQADAPRRSPARVRPYTADLVTRLLDLAGLAVERFETAGGGSLSEHEMVVVARRGLDPPQVRDFRVRPLTPEVAWTRAEWAVTATVTDANRDVAGGRASVSFGAAGPPCSAPLDRATLAGSALGLRLVLEAAPPGRLDATFVVEDAVGVPSTPIAFYLTLADAPRPAASRAFRGRLAALEGVAGSGD